MTDIRCPQCNEPLASAETPCVACTPTRMDLAAQPRPSQAGDATIPDAPAARRTTPPTIDITLPEQVMGDAPPTLVPQPQRGRPADVTEPNQTPRTVAFAKRPASPEFPSISGYRVEKVLGEGGMGAVFLAHDEMLDRKVAIKVITNADGDKTAQARFVREARSMASAEHPNIVRVLSFGTVAERPYLVMELVDGESLADRIRNVKRFPAAEALKLLRPVVEALAASWSKGIVHRDIKPSNILIDSKGHVRVADFGLAKTASGGTDSELTGSGLMVGTPFYVAPEQATAQEVDFRADIYSVGIVLYEMLAGEKPFTGSNAISVVAKHLHEQLPPLRERRNDLSPRLIALVEKMTAKSADKRHASYELLLRDFDAVINEPAPRPMPAPAPQPRVVVAPAAPAARPVASVAAVPSRKWMGPAVAAVVVVLAIGGAMIASRNDSSEKPVASTQAAAGGQAPASVVEVTGTDSPATETTTQVAVLPAPEALAAFTSGMTLLDADKPSDAIAQFDKALKIESTYASARLRKAEALATLDSTIDAEREYLQLLSDKAQLTRLDQREQFLALAGLALLRDNQGAIVRLRSDTKNAYDADEGFVRIQKAFQRRQTKANDLELQRALQSTASPRPASQQPQVSGYPPPPGAGQAQPPYPPPPYYPPPQPPPRPPGPPGGGPPPPPRP